MYVINLDNKNSKGTHLISLYTAAYFDSFGVEYISQEVLNKIKDKWNEILTILKYKIIQESILCGFYCITFIQYMLAVKTLLDYTNLLSLSDYKKNNKIIYKYFKDKCGRRSKSGV